MKTNFLLGFAATLMMAMPLMSSANPSGKIKITPSKEIVTEKRTSAMNFTRIEVSRLVRLTIENRTDDVIEVRANENLLPYIELSVSDGKLTAAISDEVNIMVTKFNNVVAEVTIPNNGRIESVEVYGASRLKILPHMRVSTFEAEVYGASVFEGNIVAEQCKMEIYGASKSAFDFEGGQLSLEVYGASGVSGDVKAVKTKVELYGASKLKLNGQSESASIDVSGASGFDGLNFDTPVCSVEVSGASGVKVNCTESLSAKSSGASSLVYKGDCRISSMSTSSAGSIKKL